MFTSEAGAKLFFWNALCALVLNRVARVAFGLAIVAAVVWSSLAFGPSLLLRTAGGCVASIFRLLRTGGFGMFMVILLPLGERRFIALVFVLTAGFIFAVCVFVS